MIDSFDRKGAQIDLGQLAKKAAGGRVKYISGH
jgi:hypothetical protein